MAVFYRLSRRWQVPIAGGPEVCGQSFGHHCFGSWTATGGSVRSAGLGDGATPEVRIAPHATGKSTIAKLALDAATLPPAGICTMCRNDLFPSHRRDGDSAGRFAAVIGLPGGADPR